MTGLLVRWRNEWEQAEEELEVTSAGRESAAVETRGIPAAAIDTDKTLDLAALVADHAVIRLPVVALTFAAVVFASVALAFLWLAITP